VNAARLVRRARCAPPRPRGPSVADADRLLAALAEAKTNAERRDRALFVTMLRSGIRVGSAVALEVDDLDLDAGTLRLRTMKNGDTDVVFLPPDVVVLLREYVATDGPLFPGMNGERLGTRQVARRLSEWATRAGLRHLNPHGLRHAFGQRLYDQTGDLLVVARAMTHRSLSSTSVYARPSEQRVRAAVGAR
jgi:integrase